MISMVTLLIAMRMSNGAYSHQQNMLISFHPIPPLQVEALQQGLRYLSKLEAKVSDLELRRKLVMLSCVQRCMSLKNWLLVHLHLFLFYLYRRMNGLRSLTLLYRGQYQIGLKEEIFWVQLLRLMMG